MMLILFMFAKFYVYFNDYKCEMYTAFIITFPDSFHLEQSYFHDDINVSTHKTTYQTIVYYSYDLFTVIFVILVHDIEFSTVQHL